MDILDDLLLHQEMQAANALFPVRRAYNIQNRFQHINNFDKWDDVEFWKRFRLSKSSVLEILALIEPEIKAATTRYRFLINMFVSKRSAIL